MPEPTEPAGQCCYGGGTPTYTPSPLNSRLSKDRRRSPSSGGTIENRPPGGGASSSWSQIVDGNHFQRLKWFAPDTTVESIVISANSAPLAKARRRSCRISTALPWDQISVAAFCPSPA